MRTQFNNRAWTERLDEPQCKSSDSQMGSIAPGAKKKPRAKISKEIPKSLLDKRSPCLSCTSPLSCGISSMTADPPCIGVRIVYTAVSLGHDKAHCGDAAPLTALQEVSSSVSNTIEPRGLIGLLLCSGSINPTDRIEIIKSVRRRRRWTASENVRFCCHPTLIVC